MLFDERIVLVGDVLSAFAFCFLPSVFGHFFVTFDLSPLFPCLPPFFSRFSFQNFFSILHHIMLAESTQANDLNLDIGGGRNNGGEEVHNIASILFEVFGRPDSRRINFSS